MKFNRFIQLVKLVNKLRHEEMKERLILAAFTSHQMGAGGDMTFGEYLSHLGLSDESPRSKPAEDDTETLRRMGIEVKKVKKVEK